MPSAWHKLASMHPHHHHHQYQQQQHQQHHHQTQDRAAIKWKSNKNQKNPKQRNAKQMVLCGPNKNGWLSASSSSSVPAAAASAASSSNTGSGSNQMEIEQEPEEPQAKKRKTDGSLWPEQEWLANHPGNVSVKVIVPDEQGKSQWDFNGQTLEYSLDIESLVSVLKKKIMEDLGIPPNKQKLKMDPIGFLKDRESLAYYNFSDGITVELGSKQRGGRK
eukprot:TRINITY_DN10808_c0_g1_i1.p1 TRINITY_DN10808_c0_g1~~TRINITY_DN10808_c0_g1_i1.p1  ORF type:complete len:219 (+),score=88.79 TRINITY_DN10808_c0_g1_i1:75-731(+)